MSNRNAERQKAKALNATDAAAIIKATLPYAFERMTAAQIDQLQRVFDSYVVNLAVQKEVDELDRKSITARSGQYTNRDSEIVARRDKAAQDFIEIHELDQRVRLDFQKLLKRDAMKPATDNPNEAAYWLRVRKTLETEGVWLLSYQPLIRDPDDLSRHIIDPHNWMVWLSLGADGSGFPTQTGLLDRDALLGNQRLGAGYYCNVHQGNIQTTLKTAIRKILDQVETGETLHGILARDRRQAAFGVVPITDTLGGASFPSQNIWKAPRADLLAAMNLNIGGNVKKSSACVLVAALDTGVAAQQLADYMTASRTGSERAITVLTVVKVVGAIAGASVAVYGLAVGLVRILAVEGAEAATGAGTAAGTGGAPPNTMRPMAYQDTNYIGAEAERDTLNAANQTLQTGDSAAMNRYDLAEANRNRKGIEQMRREMNALPNWDGVSDYSATMDRKLELIERWNRRWGTPP